jgi:hypothetical protein
MLGMTGASNAASGAFSSDLVIASDTGRAGRGFDFIHASRKHAIRKTANPLRNIEPPIVEINSCGKNLGPASAINNPNERVRKLPAISFTLVKVMSSSDLAGLSPPDLLR